MRPADHLVGNATHDNSRYCLARAGESYLVYLPNGGSAELDLTGVNGRFTVSWFDPRNGGALQRTSVNMLQGGGMASLGAPPSAPVEDWLVVVRRSE